VGAYQEKPEKIFRKKWWFKNGNVFCRTINDDQEFCRKAVAGDMTAIRFFTPEGQFHFEAGVLKGKRLPESRLAQKAREAEITRRKQEAEIARLERAAKIERLKQEAEIARLERQANLAKLQKEAPPPTRQPQSRTPVTGDSQVEDAFWTVARTSRNTADVKAYLERYPSGRYAAQAKTRLALLENFAAVKGIEFGTYHAIVIGNDNYKYLPKLQTAVNDARAVAKLLTSIYGFKVKTLINVSRAKIVETLDEYREKLTDLDNLLIYYAGHGWQDQDTNRGYWLPVDAKKDRRTHWISNATVSDTLKALLAKHIIVVADSCYSGTLARGAGASLRNADYWKKMVNKRARVALTSGGLEPVADQGGGGHSPFARAFMDSLRGNEAVMDATQMFSEMRRPIMINANQTPEYSDVRDAGHDGGDFLFVRKN